MGRNPSWNKLHDHLGPQWLIKENTPMSKIAEKIAQWVWSQSGLDPDETQFDDHLTEEEFARRVQRIIEEQADG